MHVPHGMLPSGLRGKQTPSLMSGIPLPHALLQTPCLSRKPPAQWQAGWRETLFFHFEHVLRNRFSACRTPPACGQDIGFPDTGISMKRSRQTLAKFDWETDIKTHQDTVFAISMWSIWQQTYVPQAKADHRPVLGFWYRAWWYLPGTGGDWGPQRLGN